MVIGAGADEGFFEGRAMPRFAGEEGAPEALLEVDVVTTVRGTNDAPL